MHLPCTESAGSEAEPVWCLSQGDVLPGGRELSNAEDKKRRYIPQSALLDTDW